MPVKTSRESRGWITDDFQSTPIMSTYLLAFVVTDFRSREKNDSGLLVSDYRGIVDMSCAIFTRRSISQPSR
jgi:aminopeptidase N